MDRARKLRTAGEWLWLLAWGVASSVWCLTGAGQLGATYDEPFYLRAGLERWRTGSRHDLLGAGTMPLPAEVQTLPLYLWERWQGAPLDLEGDFEKWLSWARAGTLVFWWLLLGHGWRAGRRLAGPWGGALAVALLACEPSLLAHAGLATTDVALSACLLALVYHFRNGREAGWPRRVGLPAVAAALRPRALLNWACAAALALLAASSTFRVQIGVRFVLPLVALAVVGLAAAVVEAARRGAGAGGASPGRPRPSPPFSGPRGVRRPPGRTACATRTSAGGAGRKATGK